MEFKSQICTSREQSERLLALGLKRKTADMGLVYVTHDPSGKEIEPEPEFIGVSDKLWERETRQTVLFSKQKQIPAWSLHRLLLLVPKEVNINGFKFPLRSDVLMRFDKTDDMYETILGIIERLIKEGYFNKNYLEDKQ